MSRECQTDILIVGARLGGVAAALAALRLGKKILLSEETDWIGGQLTAQAVPPDEQPGSRGPAAPKRISGSAVGFAPTISAIILCSRRHGSTRI